MVGLLKRKLEKLQNNDDLRLFLLRSIDYISVSLKLKMNLLKNLALFSCPWN